MATLSNAPMEQSTSSLDKLLAQLPDGASVALVSMLGSLCPVTLGHVQCFVEARHVVLGHSEMKVVRPARLEHFDECLGFISLNDDHHVGMKLMAKGQKALSIADRSRLVNLATAEYPWLCHDDGREILRLRNRWPNVRFTEIDMNGADDVVTYRKWRYCRPNNRMIAIGRPGSTEAVLEGMREMKIDPDDGHCFLGPELPDISSTAARDASCRGDREALLTMLHPDVADWLLERDGWQKQNTRLPHRDQMKDMPQRQELAQNKGCENLKDSNRLKRSTLSDFLRCLEGCKR